MRSPVRVAVGVLPLVALVAVGGGRAGAAATPPPVFDVAVDAAPVALSAGVPSVLPLGIDAGVARSSVAINSQPNAVSQAAVVWLPLAEAAPALFGLPPLPTDASLWCYSYFPGDPREAACGGPAQNVGVFDVAGGSGRTKTSGETADPTTLRSESAVAAASVRGASSLPVPVSVGNVASAARGGADGARMAAGASTAVSDLDVAGVLRIRALRTEVTGAVGGTPGSAVHQESLVLSGATVAGQPVTIDNAGVHVGDTAAGSELFDAQKQVNDALAGAGIQVRTLPPAPPKVADDGTTLEVTSGGLVVSLSAGGQAAVELRLGVSRLVMSAHRDDNAAAASGLGDAGSVSGSEGAPASPADVSPAAEPAGPSGDLALPPPSAPAPGAGSGPPSATPFRREVLGTDLAASTWRIPYAPFALLVLTGPLLVQARRLSLTRR